MMYQSLSLFHSFIFCISVTSSCHPILGNLNRKKKLFSAAMTKFTKTPGGRNISVMTVYRQDAITRRNRQSPGESSKTCNALWVGYYGHFAYFNIIIKQCYMHKLIKKLIWEITLSPIYPYPLYLMSWFRYRNMI